MSGRTDRRRALPALTGASLLLCAAAISCAGAKTPVALGPAAPAVAPYSASLGLSLALGGKGVLVSGGCAVVPGQGARVELRDPAGATRLLMLLKPAEGTLIDPVEGLSYTWEEASRELPWGAAELLAVFSGSFPEGAEIEGGRGGAREARWKNGEGRVKGTFAPSSSGPFPYGSAQIAGPRGASLRITWKSSRPGTFAESVFQAPPGMPLAPSDPGAILREVRP